MYTQDMETIYNVGRYFGKIFNHNFFSFLHFNFDYHFGWQVTSQSDQLSNACKSTKQQLGHRRTLISFANKGFTH